MKKLYISLVIILFASAASAQILNGGFESWTSGEPDDWNTGNVPGLYTPISQSLDPHSGTYALKGEVVDFSGQNYPPYLQPADQYGFPVSQQYAFFNLWYKLNISITEALFVQAIFTDNTGTTVGYGGTTVSTNTSTYTFLTIPVTYLSTPDRVFILVTITDTSGGSGTLGSYFIIDDLQLTNSVGVAEINSFNDFNIVSNLSQNSIKINSGISLKSDGHLTVTDISGRIMYSQNLIMGTEFNREIFIEGIKSGIYFITLYNDGEKIIKKIILM
jgi:hypothetical protein